MARLSSFLPPEITRRPNLPGVRRSNVRLRGRVSPGAVPGGLATGLSPAPGLEPLPGSGSSAGTLPGPGPLNTPLTTALGSFGSGEGFGAPRESFAPVSGFLGDATRSALAPQGGAPQTARLGASAPGQVEGLTALRQRNLGAQAESQGRLIGNSIVPPVPFQSFQDFFRARSLQRQFQNSIDGPSGQRNSIPIDQARLRAAGQPFEGAQSAGVGGAPGGEAAATSSGATQPLVAGAQAQQQQPVAGGLGGFNLGLAENQALFAALRQAFMRMLVPSASPVVPAFSGIMGRPGLEPEVGGRFGL